MTEHESYDGTEIERTATSSTYTWPSENDLNSLKEYVDGLYAVGAIGDETVTVWTAPRSIKVRVASDDLMPRAEAGRRYIRVAELDRLHKKVLHTQVAAAAMFVIAAVLVLLLVLEGVR